MLIAKMKIHSSFCIERLCGFALLLVIFGLGQNNPILFYILSSVFLYFVYMQREMHFGLFIRWSLFYIFIYSTYF